MRTLLLTAKTIDPSADGRPSHPRAFRPCWNIALVLVLLFDASVSFSRGAPSDPAPFRNDRILIKPKRGQNPAQLAHLHATLGAQVFRKFKDVEDIHVLKLPGGLAVPQAIATYQQSGLVEFAEPDYWVYPATAPNDPYYLNGSLWHLHNTGQSGGVPDADIDAPEGWETRLSASNTVVALVDTGIRYTHQDLAPNMWVNPGEIAGNGVDDDGNGIVDDVHGLNAPANSGDPIDVAGHGTQVAGMLGAVGNNGLGVVGVAWQVKLMACRYADDAGNGSLSDVVQCFDYARAKRAQVINASFVVTAYSSALYSAINSCRSAGIIVVAAAGNDANNNDATPYYPASYNLDNIVAVAATTRTDALANYSNYGATSVDLGAPGSDITTTSHGSDSAYVVNNGTSFAAPVVAGAFALLQARYPGDSHGQLINRLLSTTDPLAGLARKCVTGGRVNLAKALGPSVIASFTASPTTGAIPLTVNFTDTSYGAVRWAWDFGDGTGNSEQNPSHTYTSDGTFVVTLTVTSTGGQTSTTNQTVVAVANYQISSGAFAWVNPAGMTTLSLSDDGISPAQALPFPFIFYSQSYTSLYIGANGLIGFDSQGLSTAANTDLPNNNLPNNVLCPFWDNLNPAAGGTVSIGTIGSAPNRKVVVSWASVPAAGGGPPASFTFQVILEETSNRILFQYQDVSPGSHNASAAGKSATVGLEHASGLVAAKFSYNGSTLVSNGQTIDFAPSLSGAMTVSPAGGFASSGNVGGPFSPASAVYTIANGAGWTMNWAVSKTQNWLSLPATNGSLAPGQSTNVTVMINANANSLSAGNYADSLAFTNVTTGLGNTTRAVSLSVSGTGLLAVSPTANLSVNGIEGGPFSPSIQSYTLMNAGTAALNWAVRSSQNWTTLSPTNGALAPGANAPMTVSINTNANLLATGSYSASLTFSNVSTGQGNTSRSVSLTVYPAPGFLAVTPTNGFTTSGFIGVPFSPSSQTYTLTNSGGSNLTWTVSKTATWLSLSSIAGTLAPGHCTNLTVSINTNTTALSAGTYTDTISFSNTSTSDGNTTRLAQLKVNAPPRLQALGLTPQGQFVLKLIGEPGRSYIVEASADFQTWTSIATNTAGPDGTFSFADAQSVHWPRRIYRGVVFP
jgi:PKD repeat protein